MEESKKDIGKLKKPKIEPQIDLNILAEGYTGSISGKDNTILEISLGNYKFLFCYKKDDNFKGFLKIKDEEKGKIVFLSDYFFNQYIKHSFVDMDKDGHLELFVELSLGPSSYIWKCILMFDIIDNVLKSFRIDNSDIISNESKCLKVVLKESPSAIGITYTYFLTYSNNKFKLFQIDDEKFNILKNYLNNILEIETELKDLDTEVRTDILNKHYIGYLVQQKLLGIDYNEQEIILGNGPIKIFNLEILEKAKKRFLEIVNQNYELVENI